MPETYHHQITRAFGCRDGSYLQRDSVMPSVATIATGAASSVESRPKVISHFAMPFDSELVESWIQLPIRLPTTPYVVLCYIFHLDLWYVFWKRHGRWVCMHLEGYIHG